MRRIYIPEIPDNISLELTTIESTLEWLKRLEVAQKRLEKELEQIRMVLKYVIYPKFNQLNKEASMSDDERYGPKY